MNARRYLKLQHKKRFEEAVIAYLKFTLPFASDIYNVELGNKTISISYFNRTDEKDKAIAEALDKMKEIAKTPINFEDLKMIQ